MNFLKIAVASGKGGTGKTTVSCSLARLAADSGRYVSYIDCDVEEPNGHVFLKPEILQSSTVSIPVPVIEDNKCTACGKCKDICRYNAIAVLGKTALTFPNLCHACGGCLMVCPEGAITESAREIGIVEEGVSAGIRFVHGKLRIGEAMSPPLIKAVVSAMTADGICIVDSPPGTSCPVIQAVKGSDFVILVTEPTPFGLNDLKLAVEMLRVMGLAFGVVVNRADIGDDAVFQYCKSEGIDVMLKIPDDRRIAESYSKGELVVTALPEYTEAFQSLLDGVLNARR